MRIVTLVNQGARTLYIKCALVLFIFSVSSLSAASDAIKLKEIAWLSDNANVIEALSMEPVECLNPQAPAIASIGRIAFQSPTLVGGQAAKMHLSCDACHRSGRGNPDFFIDAISNEPGTAECGEHSGFSFL